MIDPCGPGTSPIRPARADSSTHAAPTGSTPTSRGAACEMADGGRRQRSDADRHHGDVDRLRPALAVDLPEDRGVALDHPARDLLVTRPRCVGEHEPARPGHRRAAPDSVVVGPGDDLDPGALAGDRVDPSPRGGRRDEDRRPESASLRPAPRPGRGFVGGGDQLEVGVVRRFAEQPPRGLRDTEDLEGGQPEAVAFELSHTRPTPHSAARVGASRRGVSRSRRAHDGSAAAHRPRDVQRRSRNGFGSSSIMRGSHLGPAGCERAGTGRPHMGGKSRAEARNRCTCRGRGHTLRAS